MDRVNVVDALFISLNQNITFIGKLWLTVFLLFRVFILLFAGFPLFWDEGERFMCNTIHPGCANMCLDAFSPFSLCRFGFLHLVCVCLPTVLYIMHHIHQILTGITRRYYVQEHKIQIPHLGGSELDTDGVPPGGKAKGLYLLKLILRICLELAFGAGQYFLFGTSVKQDFLCLQAPCSPAVECITSRPTEKTFLLQWMLGNVVLSVILSTAELLIVLRRSARTKRDRTITSDGMKVEKREGTKKNSEREKANSISNGSCSTPLPFLKRKPNNDPTLTLWLTPKFNISPFNEVGHTPSHPSSNPGPPRTPDHSKESRSAEEVKLWNNHCGKNGSANTLFPLKLTSVTQRDCDEWCPTPTRRWRAGRDTPATTTTGRASDSSGSHDIKAWV
ncbi:gap junction delta-4 protein-like [Astyanax mexicanus]|uniref:Gap junction delta-4 protein-like n=1 Tax=Astyanax mexicanus TaxID=7994 RepID=A0A8T2M0V0_ASTMX|nr:gap junction delta-4 protein-like [Astyanax mexicanus]